MDAVNVRNLDRGHEADRKGSSRAASLVLSGVGGGAILLGAVLALKQSAPPRESQADPLAAVVERSKQTAAMPPETVRFAEVTFPSILSDSDHPTTALAAVKDERGKLVPQIEQISASAPAPVPPADRFPPAPLPVGTLLDATPVTMEPKDPLTTLASEVSKAEGGAITTAGSEGGFQLQIASFKDQGEADRFVEELRKRGLPAYRQAVQVADRGLWHRVRIGPFKTKLSAEKYKADFDKRERISSFLVDPDKVKRQEEMRASKLAARAHMEE